MKLSYNITAITLCALLSCSLYARIIPTVLGDIQENNPTILQLIDSPIMQRLKHIDQSGPEAYFSKNFPTFSRYDHSIGVYALLKLYNTSTEEQIAGLLHDSSHTVFSHLGDILFQTGANRSESYQDSIHDWFLEQMQVTKIISSMKLQIKDISPKNPQFIALEQPYPDMNADRIEYNLHTALVLKDLAQDDVQKILKALHFENGKWYFSDIVAAKKFAKLSTYYTRAFWGNPSNVALYTVSGAALKYAMHKKIISRESLHFGVDQTVVDILEASKDPVLKQFVAMLHNIQNYYSSANKDDFDIYQPIKMRGIDPLVKQANQLYRLSELCFDFKNDLQLTSKATREGVYLKLVNISDKSTKQLLIAANK